MPPPWSVQARVDGLVDCTISVNLVREVKLMGMLMTLMTMVAVMLTMEVSWRWTAGLRLPLHRHAMPLVEAGAAEAAAIMMAVVVTMC